MKKFFIALLLLAPIVASAQFNQCIKGRYSNDSIFSTSQLKIVKDIDYAKRKKWPGSDSMTLKMDVYMPDTSLDPVKKRPLILLIHGGAFLTGNKSNMKYFGEAYAQRGFVAVSIQYQLGWNCPSTDILSLCLLCGNKSADMVRAIYRATQDARGAIKYLVQQQKNYHIDTSSIFLMGESAGSITALHTAFWNQQEADTFCKTCSNLLGNLDAVNDQLPNQFTIKGVVNSCGAINNKNILNNNIPVIGFHDDNDCVVPYNSGRLINCLGCTAFPFAAGSKQINTSLNSQGICNQLNTRPNSFNHCSYPKGAVLEKSTCFIKSVLCKTCTSSSSNTIWNIPNCDSGYILKTPFQLAPKAQVYPNPSTGLITLVIENKSQDYFVEVINSTGRIVLLSDISLKETIINLNTLSNGLYNVLLKDSRGQILYQERIQKIN
jgi:hypothetical protein